MGFAVRRARLGDAATIGAINVASWQIAYKNLVPAALLAALSVDKRIASWEARIDDPMRMIWVVDDDGKVLGFADAGPTRDQEGQRGTGEVYALHILPEQWGKGAGRLLLASVLEDLGAERFAEATLWVLEKNARARRFYEAAGFHADGGAKTTNYRGALIEEVRYRRSLVPARSAANSGP